MLPFAELVSFLEERMTMSHIYQPLLIRGLVEADGTATLRQIALYFLAQDESQIKFYEKRIKEMPLKVLAKHGIAEREGELVTLNVVKLSYEQKAQLKMICERKLQEFIASRGLKIWDYRLLDGPVSGTVYYEVMKEAGGMCAACGATKKDRPLDVDHIIPRSRKGKSTKDNLQVLCSKCNRSKGNRDQTDFRGSPSAEHTDGCPFCHANMPSENIIAEHNTVYAIRDKFEVSDGHLLVIPKRHTADYFSMSTQERHDAEGLIRVLKRKAEFEDKSITGFNVGSNSGASAGQTIFHAHIHLIPRRAGDTPAPRGGVRGVIPSKMSY